MIDYIKKNHLGLLIIVFMIASSLFGGAKEVVKPLGSINNDTTTISNPFRFQQGIINDTTLTQTGAATFAANPLTLNSIGVYAVRQAFQTGTTTICYLQNPSTTASTTPIGNVVVYPATGTSTLVSAPTITFATSTTQYATTSVFSSFSFTGTVWNSPVVATSTGNANNNVGVIIPPSGYINVKMTGGGDVNGFGITNTGECSVLLRSIQ